jgi:plastocyanin
MLLIGALGLFGGRVAAAPSDPGAARAHAAPASAATWQSLAGTQSPDMAVQMLQFYPTALVVNVGDTITWTNPTMELHTVTFFAPGQERPRFDRDDPLQAQVQGSGLIDGSAYVNSGLLDAGESYSAVAAQEGTYTYTCLLHREMNGTLEVRSAGAEPVPMVEPRVAAQAAQPVIAEWQAQAAAYQPRVDARPDGTREYVISGGMGDAVAAVMRFTPGNLRLQVGDTITWDNTDLETPHTVTFGPVEGEPSDPWGSPRAFSGLEALNSGYFGKAWPNGETFSVTFTAPGDFAYICILHARQGMIGTLSVAPR